MKEVERQLIALGLKNLSKKNDGIFITSYSKHPKPSQPGNTEEKP